MAHASRSARSQKMQRSRTTYGLGKAGVAGDPGARRVDIVNKILIAVAAVVLLAACQPVTPVSMYPAHTGPPSVR